MANAWEDRGPGGMVQALTDTIKLSMIQPDQFFGEMPPTGGLQKPLLYAVIVGTVGVILAEIWSIGWNLLVAGAAAGNSRSDAAFMGAFSVGFGLVIILLSPILTTIGLFISSGLTHLGLLIVGGAKRNFEATFRVIAYSQGPNVLSVIPFLGALVAAVWIIVMEIIGIARVHGISKGRAAVGILLFPCCCCLLVGGGAAMMFLFAGVWFARAGGR